MTYPEISGSSGFILVTSSTSLSATRNLVAPLAKGFTWAIENATTGGHSIQIIGATGTGVTIANGYTLTVYCDGTNYVTLPSSSGGTVLGVTGMAPVASSGGTNPVISMAQANGSTNGYLASIDWTTFNGKQNALGFTPAHSGANSDITSLTGLTTPLPTTEGGSGTTGGTGYRYGNGSSPDTYSPTIPWSVISGKPITYKLSFPINGITVGGNSTAFYSVSPIAGITNTSILSISMTGTTAQLLAAANIVITISYEADYNQISYTYINTSATSWTAGTGQTINIGAY